MNLRHLVPVMGVLAITAGSSVFAEDKGPTVTFNGWSDNFLYVSNANNPQDAAATAKNDKGTSIGFQSTESLKVNAKISDTVSGKINIFMHPDGNGASGIVVREGYLAWAFNSDWTFTAGKFINHIGWLSPEPTGLYSPNASLIGYQSGVGAGTTGGAGLAQLYGYANDVTGINFAYAAKDAPLSGSAHLVNGYFNGQDAFGQPPVSSLGGGNTTKPVTRQNSDLGYGLDLTYAFPKDMGNLDFDFAYDPHGGSNGPVGGGLAGLGGDVILLGLNATVKPAEGFLIGAEVIYTQTGKAKDNTKTSIDDSEFTTLQGMLLVNYALPKGSVSIPVSLTALGELWQDKFKSANPGLAAGDGTSPGAREFAIAVLTNPTNSANFGLNAELAFTSFDSKLANTDKVNATIFSVEALLAFWFRTPTVSTV